MIEIPESVHAYLTDAGVRAATDMLLDTDPDEPVAGLGWSEVVDYQRALLAACQVRTEYVETLEALWFDIWDAALPAGWSPVDPDDHIEEYDFEPSLDTFWSDETYARVQTRQRQNRYLYQMVTLSHDGVRVGIGLWDDTDTPRIAELEGFENEDGYLWSGAVPVEKGSRSFDTTILRRNVAAALAAVKDRT